MQTYLVEFRMGKEMDELFVVFKTILPSTKNRDPPSSFSVSNKSHFEMHRRGHETKNMD